jgi:hypothetical protein
MKIAEVLLKMGYKEFIVYGDTYEGIEWVEQPDSIPSKEEVMNKIVEFSTTQETVRESALTKLAALGLTEEEIATLSV